jgi:hypothetical protein
MKKVGQDGKRWKMSKERGCATKCWLCLKLAQQPVCFEDNVGHVQEDSIPLIAQACHEFVSGVQEHTI